jgi:hypothetical protein
MKIGDLVRQKSRRPAAAIRRFEGVGIIIEVYRRKARELDYRTPTSVLVFYGAPQRDGSKMKNEIWFHKSELELVHGEL